MFARSGTPLVADVATTIYRALSCARWMRSACQAHVHTQTENLCTFLCNAKTASSAGRAACDGVGVESLSEARTPQCILGCMSGPARTVVSAPLSLSAAQPRVPGIRPAIEQETTDVIMKRGSFEKAFLQQSAKASEQYASVHE